MSFPLFGILFYSLTIMFATENLKLFISKKHIPFASMIISCIGTFTMNINIFLILGFKLNIYGYVFSTILTGVVLSKGSNYLHYLEHQLKDLAPVIQNIKQSVNSINTNNTNTKN